MVIVSSNTFSCNESVGIVVRELKKSVEVKYDSVVRKFWKKNGNAVGQSGSWRTVWLIPYDPDRYAKVKEANYRSAFQSKMQFMKWFDVSTEAMKRIESIIMKEKNHDDS